MLPKVKLESDANTLRVRALALVSPRHRNILSMRDIDERIRIAMGHTVMTADRKLLLVRNSKVGSSSVIQLVYRYALGEKGPEMVDRICPEVIHGFRDWQPCYEAIVSHEPVIFAQVRHPVDRLMSAFRNFFVANSHDWRWRHMLHMKRLGYSVQNPIEKNLDIFLDYVDLSFATSERYTDRHWRKQIHNIGYGAIDFDVIGKTENLTASIKEVLERANIPDNGLTDVLEERHNNTDAVRDRYQPTAQQRRRIEDLYADDFEAFGF